MIEKDYLFNQQVNMKGYLQNIFPLANFFGWISPSLMRVRNRKKVLSRQLQKYLHSWTIYKDNLIENKVQRH